MKTKRQNQNLISLIKDLKSHSRKEKSKVWNSIAKNLEKPVRKRSKVNIHKINKQTKENETIVVPGKVLGTGTLNHNVTVAAFQFSESSLKKLKNTISINDLMKKNPKGKDIRIIG